MAGDSTYDLVTGQSNNVQPLNAENVFVNLLEESNIDLTKPYWVEAYTEGINLAGKVCTVCGDFTLSSFSNANVIFFNKDLMDEYSMEYPYEDALSGTWTLDKFISISESVTADLNGDGAVDTNDRIGLLGWHNTMQPFFTSCGLNYTEVNSDGRRVLLTPTDQMVSAAEKMYAFCHSDSFIETTANKLTTDETIFPFFMNGHTMFFGQVLSTVENLREMEADFGIVPYADFHRLEDLCNQFEEANSRYMVIDNV